jgi:hypothetical protein
MKRTAPLAGPVSVLGAVLILLAVWTIRAETREGGGIEMVGPHV